MLSEREMPWPHSAELGVGMWDCPTSGQKWVKGHLENQCGFRTQPVREPASPFHLILPLQSLSHLSCGLPCLLAGVMGKGRRGWGTKSFARLWG